MALCYNANIVLPKSKMAKTEIRHFPLLSDIIAFVTAMRDVKQEPLEAIVDYRFRENGRKKIGQIYTVRVKYDRSRMLYGVRVLAHVPKPQTILENLGFSEMPAIALQSAVDKIRDDFVCAMGDDAGIFREEISLAKQGEMDLNSKLIEVDRYLNDCGIPIPDRPWRAAPLVHYLYGENWMNMRSQVEMWFEEKYGVHHQQETIGYRRAVVLVAHTPHEVDFPLIYGTCCINPLKWIKGVTSGLFSHMTKEEVTQLAESILALHPCFDEIRDLPSKCTEDLSASVSNLMTYDPHLSKWASQQMVEKTLKEYIRIKGGNPTKTHRLGILAEEAESLGLPECDRKLIQASCADAGIRYDKKLVLLNDAEQAQHAAIKLCAHIARNF